MIGIFTGAQPQGARGSEGHRTATIEKEIDDGQVMRQRALKRAEKAFKHFAFAFFFTRLLFQLNLDVVKRELTFLTVLHYRH